MRCANSMTVVSESPVVFPSPMLHPGIPVGPPSMPLLSSVFGQPPILIPPSPAVLLAPMMHPQLVSLPPTSYSPVPVPLLPLPYSFPLTPPLLQSPHQAYTTFPSPGNHLSAIAAAAIGAESGNAYERLLALDDTIQRQGIPRSMLDSLSLLQTLSSEDAVRMTAQHGRCTICLGDFEELNVLRRLPCLCVFHRDCIDRYFVDNVVCPVCRSSLRT